MPALESLRRHHTFRSRQITELYGKIVADAGDIKSLTGRETEALCLVAEGQSTKEMAVSLGIRTKTVETHRSHILRKLKLHSTAALVRYAIKHGLVEM